MKCPLICQIISLMRHFWFSLFLIGFCFSFPFSAIAQRRSDPSPKQLFEGAISLPAFRDNPKGESFCWNARTRTEVFIDYYRSTGNVAYLEAGLDYCDWLLSRMDSSPDGYKGWIGPSLYDKRYWTDVLVGDAILFDGMLDYAILVFEDRALKAGYASRVAPYIASAKRNFVEKYDKRGTWIEDGPYGGYIASANFLKEGNLNEWIHSPNSSGAGVSHPFNKQMDAALVCLKLHRVTGEAFYRDRAERIFFTVKSHFQFFDDHYCWNYYEPLYPGDVDLVKRDTRHGIWVHPWRSGYQAGEVSKIVEAYHYGIVFDEQDIRRIINTNLKVMWNGSREDPKFINSNGLGADGDTTGLAAFKRAYGHSNVVKNGGELWTSLLDFDQTIRDLYALRFKGDTLSEGYQRYKREVLATPPGFFRKYARGKVTVPKFAFTECKELYAAVALPHILPKGGNSILLCKSWSSGNLAIDLYSPRGKKVANLYSGRIREGVFFIQWDGKDPQTKEQLKGNYVVRWSKDGGYREFPIAIQ